jgi:ATP-dependent Clp protease ATP-binding subunit ClpA
MYERFTDRARKVMQLATEEAQRFNHEYIGTEHILLGLVKEGSGVAADVLKNLNVYLPRVRLEVEKIVQPGPDMVSMGRLPQTPRAKKVVEFSIEEARKLNCAYVGTEHLLLGLIREQEGLAAQVLINLGLSLPAIRNEILRLLGDARAIPHGGSQEIEAPDLVVAGSDVPNDLPTGLAKPLAYLGTLIELFTKMNEEAVASRNFDRAAHLEDLTFDLRRARNFLLRDRASGNAED